MRLHYYWDGIGNFGDDLNAWLWPRLIPDLLDDNPDTLFLALCHTLHRLAQRPDPVLSEPSAHRRACERLLESLDRLRNDLRQGLSAEMRAWR